jgi:hypothetical protein
MVWATSLAWMTTLGEKHMDKRDVSARHPKVPTDPKCKALTVLQDNSGFAIDRCCSFFFGLWLFSVEGFGPTSIAQLLQFRIDNIRS